jgi:hypothetical protein
MGPEMSGGHFLSTRACLSVGKGAVVSETWGDDNESTARERNPWEQEINFLHYAYFQSKVNLLTLVFGLCFHHFSSWT